MIITYPSFIENNPHDLLSPHHDSFVSCFESRFNDSLDEIGLRDFTFFDKDLNQKYYIHIQDYFLHSQKYNKKKDSFLYSEYTDYFQTYDLYLKIQISTDPLNSITKWIRAGTVPKMQDRGGFIRNGVKRVILHQLIRSPGLYISLNINPVTTTSLVINTFLKHRKISARIIPEYGSWLKMDVGIGGPRVRPNRNDIIPHQTRDRIRCTTESFYKAPFTLLLCGLGIPPRSLLKVCSIGAFENERNVDIWNDEIQECRLGDFPKPWSRQQALASLWLNIKPFKRRRIPRTPEAVQELVFSSFIKPTKYNFGSVGRTQFCNTLGIKESISKRQLNVEDLCLLANHLINLRWDTTIVPESGTPTLQVVDSEAMQNRRMRPSGELLLNCLMNEFRNLERRDSRLSRSLVDKNPFNRNIYEPKFKKVPKSINNLAYLNSSFLPKIKKVKSNTIKNLKSAESFKGAKNKNNHENTDSIFWNDKFYIQVLQRLTNLFQDSIKIGSKNFLSATQISQLEDTLNPISDLTLKRRVSSLGPNGITRAQASIPMRNIHPTSYGRICPIETPEGQNAGLVRSLAMHSTISDYGQLQVPYVTYNDTKVSGFFHYIDSFSEENKTLGLPDVMITQHNPSVASAILARQNYFFNRTSLWDCTCLGLTPSQFLSVGTTLTPFLEHDDATRVLMGSNMQRQSLPLIACERPLVGTGTEALISIDSRYSNRANINGVICGFINQNIYVHDISYRQYLRNFNSSPHLFGYLSVIQPTFRQKLYLNLSLSSTSNTIKVLSLLGPKRSSKSTVSFLRPLFQVGTWLKSGTLIADDVSVENGQLALGCNLNVAYMPWDGFNFEDAIVFNQRTAQLDKMKSLHIKRLDFYTTKNQKVTSNFAGVPGVISSVQQHLDTQGIVVPGSYVRQGDALIGVIGKNLSPKTWKIRLIKKLTKIDPSFPFLNFEVMDQSFCVPLGFSGRVIGVQKKVTEDGYHFRIYLLITRFLRIGDKLSGRHGNKGVISCLVPPQDMPHRPDGTQMDIVLNPLGVPSRMNLGQIYECLLGLAGQHLNQRFKISAFDEMFSIKASKKLVYTKLYEAHKMLNSRTLFSFHYPGKTWMIDGRYGSGFEQPVVVGFTYILKLSHQVDDKIHGRATGDYSLITQQPVQGRARGGGQRIGEMEVWAFEGFGASYCLQELLSIKSDDISGRQAAAKSLLQGSYIYARNLSTYRKPHTLRVVSYELRALCMDFKLYKSTI